MGKPHTALYLHIQELYILWQYNTMRAIFIGEFYYHLNLVKQTSSKMTPTLCFLTGNENPDVGNHID
jgi:hypothetical protein